MLYFDRIDVSEGKEFDSNKRIKISIFVTTGIFQIKILNFN